MVETEQLNLMISGRSFLKEGKFKPALEKYRQAIAFSRSFLPGVLLDYEAFLEKDLDNIALRFSLITFLFSMGLLPEAVLELEEILEIDPKNAKVYDLLGKILIKQGKTDAAIALLERAVAAGVKDINIFETLASAYLEKGAVREAIRFYEDVLSYNPYSKNTLRILGELYSRIEEYNKAADKYSAMFSDDPEVSFEIVKRLEELLEKVEASVYIRKILAEILMKCLNPDEAVRRYREILRLDRSQLLPIVERLKAIVKNYPQHPLAMIALGEALCVQGNYTESVSTYLELLKARPDSIDDVLKGYKEIIKHCPQQIMAHQALAEAYLYKGLINEALTELEEMLHYYKDSADLAIEKCRGMLKAQPNLIFAHQVLAKAYLAKSDFQRAAVEAELMIAIDKDNPAGYQILGETSLKLGQCQKALKNLETAMGIDPYNIAVQNKYQQAFIRQLELQAEGLKKRIAEDQWRVSLNQELAKIYLRMGKDEDALRELQIALRDQTRAPFIHEMIGSLYKKMGRFDLAEEQFIKAIDFAPKEASELIKSARFNLGSTYEARGEFRKALKTYEDVLQADIDFGDLKKKIKLLKTASLISLRNKSLLAVAARGGDNKIIGIWGREARVLGRAAQPDGLNVSFGQNHNMSGFSYFMSGMYKAAVEEFYLAAQLDSAFAPALNNLAVCLLADGKYNEAASRLEEALSIDSGSAIFHNNLGQAYYLASDLVSAQREFERALELDPTLSAANINLGDIYYLQNKAALALKNYNKVGEFDVLSELADQRLLFKMV